MNKAAETLEYLRTILREGRSLREHIEGQLSSVIEEINRIKQSSEYVEHLRQEDLKRRHDEQIQSLRRDRESKDS